MALFKDAEGVEKVIDKTPFTLAEACLRSLLNLFTLLAQASFLLNLLLLRMIPYWLTPFPYPFLHSYFIRFSADKVSAIVYLADGLECRCLQLRPASTIADLIEHMLQVGRCQTTPNRIDCNDRVSRAGPRGLAGSQQYRPPHVGRACR